MNFYKTILRSVIQSLQPQTRTCSNSRKIFVHQDLKDCSHIFIRNDMLKKSLCPTYDGPYRVLSRKKKVFEIQLPNRISFVSIDRLKPAYVLNEKCSDSNVDNNLCKSNSVVSEPTTQ
ncbi:Pol polyprotein, partial [Operophtera brumata]